MNTRQTDGDRLLVIYLLVTVFLFLLLILSTIMTKTSVLWIALYVFSSVAYFFYGWYLVRQGRIGTLRYLVEIMIIWAVVYVVFQALWVVWYLSKYD